jgi:hypothetical protein
MPVFKPRHLVILLVALAGVTISILVWIAWHDPAINFLPHDRRAEWIVFPGAVDARAHWFASLDASKRMHDCGKSCCFWPGSRKRCSGSGKLL